MDASTEPDVSVFNGDDSGTPSLVSVVYAVHAGAADLPAFRLCIAPETTPLPNDPSHPMPLSNFPGVAPGGMALLGNVHGIFSVTVLSALEIQNSPTDKFSTCGAATTDGNLAFRAPVGMLSFTSAIEILVLTGGMAPIAKVVAADSTTYSAGGAPHFQFGNFAQSLQGPITATFGTQQTPALDNLGAASFGALTPKASQATAFNSANPTPADYDNFGVQANGKFYSLSDIQHASDPTTTPGQFFGSRLNGYALLLVDDVGGKSQHMVAVPLVP